MKGSASQSLETLRSDPECIQSVFLLFANFFSPYGLVSVLQGSPYRKGIVSPVFSLT